MGYYPDLIKPGVANALYGIMQDAAKANAGSAKVAAGTSDQSPAPAATKSQASPMPKVSIVNLPNPYPTLDSLMPKVGVSLPSQISDDPAPAPAVSQNASTNVFKVNGKPVVNETVKTVSLEPAGPMEGNAFKTSVSYGSPDYEKLNGQTNWKMPWPKLIDEEAEQADYFSSLQKNRKNAGMNLDAASSIRQISDQTLAQPEVKPAIQPEPQPAVQTVAQPEVKSEPQPEVKAVAGPGRPPFFYPDEPKAVVKSEEKPNAFKVPMTAAQYGEGSRFNGIADDAYRATMDNYELDRANMAQQRSLINQSAQHDYNLMNLQDDMLRKQLAEGESLKNAYGRNQESDWKDWVNPFGIVSGIAEPLYTRKVYNPNTRSYENQGPSSLKEAVGNLVRNVATAGSGLKVAKRGNNWSFGYDSTMPNYFRTMQLNNAAAPYQRYEALQDSLANAAINPAFKSWTVGTATPVAEHPYKQYADAEVARDYGYRTALDNAEQMAKIKGWAPGSKEYGDYLDSQLGLSKSLESDIEEKAAQLKAIGYTDEQVEEFKRELVKSRLGLGTKGMTAKEMADYELAARKLANDEAAAQQKLVNDTLSLKAGFVRSIMENDPYISAEKASAKADALMNAIYGGNPFFQNDAPKAGGQPATASEPAVPGSSEAPAPDNTDLNNAFTGAAVKAERRMPKAEVKPTPRYEIKVHPKLGTQVAIDNSTGERVVPFNAQQMAESRDRLTDAYADIASRVKANLLPSIDEVQAWLDAEEDHRAHTLNVNDNSIKGTGFDNTTDKNGTTPGINQMRNEMLDLKESLANRKKAYDASSELVRKTIDSGSLLDSGDEQATDQFKSDLGNLREQIRKEEGGAIQSMRIPMRDPMTGQTTYGYQFTSPQTEAFADEQVAGGTSRSQIIAHIVPELNEAIRTYYLQYHILPNEETVWKMAKPMLDGMEKPLQKAIQNDTFFGNEDPINRAIVGSYARKYISTLKR